MMEELQNILLAHAARYPLMQPTDAVKLIYQNEFGGGHMIRDEEACLAYLRLEYAATEKDPAVPLQEDIGNGIVRINLAAVAQGDLEALGLRFIRSAAAHQGSPDRFLEKLTLLEELTSQGAFAFDAAGLAAYLNAYARQGYPAVSHSEVYRQAYHPAYRVVLK